jgi:hypothetical protein
MRPMDTSEDAWQYMQEAMRKMTPAQRFRRAFKLTSFAHRLALSELRRQFPLENERRLRLRLLARTVDAATMKAAFGWPADGLPTETLDPIVAGAR